jgi:hypothetical protein
VEGIGEEVGECEGFGSVALEGGLLGGGEIGEAGFVEAEEGPRGEEAVPGEEGGNVGAEDEAGESGGKEEEGREVLFGGAKLVYCAEGRSWGTVRGVIRYVL